MKDESGIATRVLIGVVVVVAIVIGGPVSCVMQKHAKIAEAIAGGADPVLARCAFNQDRGDDAVCIARVVGK